MNTKKYKKYILGTKQILDQSQTEKTPYMVSICDKNFIVYKGVFSPKYFFDTEIFATNLPINSGDEILEIGPGTGIISIMTLYRGAKGAVCVDINKKAVKNTIENSKYHELQDKLDARQGNIYASIKKNEKFDVIFWNIPFGLVPVEKKLSFLEKSVFDPGYCATEIFIRDAKQFLKSKGRIYIGFSTTLGNFERLTQIAQKNDYSLKLIYQEESSEKYPVKFEIFELVKK